MVSVSPESKSDLTRSVKEEVQSVVGTGVDVDRILNSKLFKILYKRIEESNARFRDLPETYKTAAMAIALSGKRGVIPSLETYVFRRKIPSMAEFLSLQYVPTVSHFYDSEKGSPWRTDLIKIFSSESAVLEWILTGAIGTAKTSNSLLAHFYNLYRINSLREPQHTLGSDPGKSMNLQLITVSLDKARAMIDKMKTFLDACPYYEAIKEVDEVNNFRVPEGVMIDKIPYVLDKYAIYLPNKIKVVTGSRATHAIGDDLFGGSLDEAEFHGGVKGAEKAMDLYSQILERIRSRFVLQRFTLMTLVSSIMHDTGVIVAHLKSAVQSKDVRTHVSQFNIWEVKQPRLLEQGWFQVLRGNRRYPSKILTKEEHEQEERGEFVMPSGCKLIKVPNLYRKDFEMKIEQSLRNLAGEYTIQDDKPFDEVDNCEDLNLCPVFTITAPLEATEPLIDQIPAAALSQYPDGKRLKRYPDTLRYVHWDLADTGEGGVAVVHKERDRAAEKTVYVVDFAARIVSPNRISFEKVEQLGLDLLDKLRLRVFRLTADQYQSVSFLQKMQTSRVAKHVGKFSVDKNLIPYNVMANLVAENSVKCGKMGLLQEQLMNLYFADGKPYSRTRKDVADALCGALYHASENADDMPVNFYSTTHIPIASFLPEKWEFV